MARHLIQIVITGAQVVGRAFTKALREELNASRQAAQRAAPSSGGATDGASSHKHAATNLKHGITLQEAMQILNVRNMQSTEEIEDKFKHLYEMNEKTKGGSFYLQSKVVRAKERIDEELQAMNTSRPLSSSDESSQSSTPPPPPT